MHVQLRVTWGRKCAWLSAALACMGVLVCLPACDESLPSYTEPGEVFTYGAVAGNPYTLVDSGVVITSALIRLTARNDHDEVLSDKASLAGSITIRLKHWPAAHRTLSLTRRDLGEPSLLSGEQLTLRPGQTISVGQRWDHRTDDGTPFWQYIGRVMDVTSQGQKYYRSDTAWFQVTGALQVYEHRQVVAIGLHEFPVTYRLFNTISDSVLTKH